MGCFFAPPSDETLGLVLDKLLSTWLDSKVDFHREYWPRSKWWMRNTEGWHAAWVRDGGVTATRVNILAPMAACPFPAWTTEAPVSAKEVYGYPIPSLQQVTRGS